MIQTVKGKPVKSLGRLYEISLTDRHRGKEVQEVALDGHPLTEPISPAN